MDAFSPPQSRIPFSKPQMHVRQMHSGLQRHYARFLKGAAAGSCMFAVLGDGEATLRNENEETTLFGPAMFWRCKSTDCQLELAAGASCIVAEISGEALARAIGNFFESGLLQSLFDNEWDRSFAVGDRILADVEEHLRAIAQEVRSQSVGGAMIVIARLRIILVNILRLSAVDRSVGLMHGETRNHLHRFRQLLEIGFRAHRSVAEYAGDLGISADRLHAVCTRELGRTPKALIDQRVAREASIGLERSTLSVKQLSYALGFRDPAHFSNFFKRMSGLSPSRYRHMLTLSTPEATASPLHNYADWP